MSGPDLPVLFFKAIPTVAQQRAGNYAKKKIIHQGLPISVENPRGSVRTGVDAGGKAWATHMKHHYGYVRGTKGADGDHYDVFVGPHPEATHAYVAETRKPPEFKARDEEKAMLGFKTEKHAREAFASAYDNPGFLGRMVPMPMEDFKARLRATPSTGGRCITEKD